VVGESGKQQTRNIRMKSKSAIVRTIVYTPESKIRNPAALIRSMWQDLGGSRELAWRLFVRDFSAKYRQSLLGVAWAFLPPIMAGLVFIVLQSKGVVRFGETDIPYPVYVLVGTTLWQLFAESLNSPLNTVRASIPMLTKIKFPREALIVSSFYQMVLSLLIKSVILVGIFFYFGIPLSRGLLFAPFAIFMLILLGMTIGLLLTPVGMLYTDVSSSLVIIIQVWFFLTPVVYPTPKRYPFSLIATVNPVSPVLSTSRELLTGGVVTEPTAFIVVCLLTMAGLFIGWVFYRLAIPILIERMSA
jgi:lipopolysaccharide transport system permease protein